MRITLIAGVVLALAGNPALAQVAGQPTLVSPPAAPARPAQPPKPSQPPKTATTPESRSAALLAVSSEPVFDEDAFARIKAALLSYSDIQVRGGWPSLPADAKLAPGASGPDVALLRRLLVITEDLPPDQETGD